MARNAILDELHAIRRQILEDYKGDTAAYLRDAQARLEASGRPISKREQRTIRRTNEAESHEMAVESQSPPSCDR
jgi:spore cortex formation protein SpoVR/YcgB (stage V sporulation)